MVKLYNYPYKFLPSSTTSAWLPVPLREHSPKQLGEESGAYGLFSLRVSLLGGLKQFLVAGKSY